MKKLLVLALMMTLVTAGYIYAAGTADQVVIGNPTAARLGSVTGKGGSRLDDNRFIACSFTSGSTNEGECDLLTTDGKNVTLHATSTYVDQEIGGSSLNGESVCVINTDKFAIVYADDNLADDGYVRIGTTTGNAINGFGTALEFEVGDMENPACAKTDTDQFVIFFNDETDTDRAKAVGCTASGSSVTCGTAVMASSTVDFFASITDCSQLNTDKFVCAFRANDDSQAPYVVAGTIGGSDAITFGPVLKLSATSVTNVMLASTKDIGGTADQFAVGYAYFSGNFSKIRACTVSSTTITCGSEYDVATTNPAGRLNDFALAFVDDTKIVLSGRSGGLTRLHAGVADVTSWGSRTLSVPDVPPMSLEQQLQPTFPFFMTDLSGIFMIRKSSSPASYYSMPWHLETSILGPSVIVE